MLVNTERKRRRRFWANCGRLIKFIKRAYHDEECDWFIKDEKENTILMQ